MSHAETGLTQELTAFASSAKFEDLPQDLIDVGATHILDSLGCGLAGSASASAMISRNYLIEEGAGFGESTVIASDTKLKPRFAAFANGLAMHADDFDDTGPQPSAARNGGIHATVPVLAAVLSLAEPRGLSGRAVMTAVHVGVEISCKLNHAMNEEHYRRGYHSTATIGMFGATAAACKILDVDESKMAQALGIVASQSAGLRANFGSMMNPFHAGHVAECAIASAELARRGFTASKGVLDNPEIGYFQATGGGFDASAVEGRLGKPWAFIDPGMWIKPYPCGALTHPALTALIELAHRENISPDLVKSVDVQTNRNLVNTLIHNRPSSALQAKFSMPFAAAIALTRRRVGLGEFKDAVVQDPAIQQMMQKVTFKAYEKREPDYSNVTTLMQVELVDGRSFSLRADFGKGNPRNPMRFDDVAEKFRGCADYIGWPSDRAEGVIALVRRFDDIEHIGALTKMLRA